MTAWSELSKPRLTPAERETPDPLARVVEAGRAAGREAGPLSPEVAARVASILAETNRSAS